MDTLTLVTRCAPWAEVRDEQSFLSPLQAYAEWSARLREYVYGVGKLDAASVARDDACDLGRWMAGAPPSIRRLDAFTEADRLHKDFHVQAARVVELVDRGRRFEAEHMVSSQGDLRRSSIALARALVKLQADMAVLDGGGP